VSPIITADFTKSNAIRQTGLQFSRGPAPPCSETAPRQPAQLPLSLLDFARGPHATSAQVAAAQLPDDLG